MKFILIRKMSIPAQRMKWHLRLLVMQLMRCADVIYFLIRYDEIIIFAFFINV